MECEAKSGEGRFTYCEIFEHIKNGKYSNDWPKQTNFLSEKKQRFSSGGIKSLLRMLEVILCVGMEWGEGQSFLWWPWTTSPDGKW